MKKSTTIQIILIIVLVGILNALLVLHTMKNNAQAEYCSITGNIAEQVMRVRNLGVPMETILKDTPKDSAVYVDIVNAVYMLEEKDPSAVKKLMVDSCLKIL